MRINTLNRKEIETLLNSGAAVTENLVLALLETALEAGQDALAKSIVQCYSQDPDVSREIEAASARLRMKDEQEQSEEREDKLLSMIKRGELRTERAAPSQAIKQAQKELRKILGSDR